MKRTRRKSWEPRAAAEQLEVRALLAGTVTASFSSGKLEIKGDSASNQIQVFEDGTSLKVQGFNGTTIKGGTTSGGVSTRTFSNAAGLKDVLIEMNAGNDTVQLGRSTLASGSPGSPTGPVSGLTPSVSLEVKSGSGDDIVRGRNLVVGNDLKIFTESGNDIVELNFGAFGDGGSAGFTNVANSVDIKTGIGNDTVCIDNVFAGNDLKIETNEGNDTLKVTNSSAGNKVILDGGSGTDSLTDDDDDDFDDDGILNNEDLDDDNDGTPDLDDDTDNDGMTDDVDNDDDGDGIDDANEDDNDLDDDGDDDVLGGFERDN